MELKFRYVYGIPGKQETYFFRYFTIEEIENTEVCIWVYEPVGEMVEIISRDQFTGLKDKNGKEIYENDKLDTGHAVFSINGIFVGSRYGSGGTILYRLIDKGPVEIIGNAHGVNP